MNIVNLYYTNNVEYYYNNLQFFIYNWIIIMKNKYYRINYEHNNNILNSN